MPLTDHRRGFIGKFQTWNFLNTITTERKPDSRNSRKAFLYADLQRLHPRQIYESTYSAQVWRSAAGLAGSFGEDSESVSLPSEQPHSGR